MSGKFSIQTPVHRNFRENSSQYSFYIPHFPDCVKIPYLAFNASPVFKWNQLCMTCFGVTYYNVVQTAWFLPCVGREVLSFFSRQKDTMMRMRTLLGESKTKQKAKTKTTWDLDMSCWVNVRQEAPALMSMVPLQTQEQQCQPPAITCGSSRKSNLNPFNSFTGKCNVGQRGVMCNLIHYPEL